MKKIIHFDETEKLYSIFLLEKGGPIINDVSLVKANEKFDNALQLSESVKKFFEYKTK